MTPELEKTISELLIHHIYEYYDGPLIYSCKSADGSQFFYSFYAQLTDEHSKHVHIPISIDQLNAFEAGQISVWSLAKGAIGYSEYYHRNTETHSYVEERVVDDELPRKDLLYFFDAGEDAVIKQTILENIDSKLFPPENHSES